MSNKAKKPSRLKAVVSEWLGINTNIYGNNSLGTTATSGLDVTAESALKLPTVWSCTRIISETIASFPLSVYEADSDGRHVARPDLPISRIIARKPNAEMPAVMFWQGMIAQALLWGNSFAEKIYGVDGRIVSLDMLPIERLTWRRLNGGDYEFSYVDLDGKRRTISEDDVFHLPGFSVTGRFGLSVIRYGANLFGSSQAAEGASASTFKNGLMPATYFKMDAVLKERQREEFRDSMRELVGAMNAGKSPLLEKGMDIGQIGINPADAQLLESRAYTASQICQWFGVPPPIVGLTDKASSWASSSEQMNLWFLQYGLLPWMKRIESAIWMHLMTPLQQQKYFAKFKYEGLLRADTKSRAEFYSTALQNGWMNRNTVARLEDAPEIPGGDIYTVQSNLIALDRLNEPQDDTDAVADAMTQFVGSSEDDNEDGA